jgi:hypothetical protein
MGRLFLCCFFAREGFAPESFARLGHGGFLMLEYQKSSAVAPKPRNSCCLKNFVRCLLVGSR